MIDDENGVLIISDDKVLCMNRLWDNAQNSASLPIYTAKTLIIKCRLEENEKICENQKVNPIVVVTLR